jgi:Putative S-adenosyl-L-methionine-dependent methyltransferase
MTKPSKPTNIFLPTYFQIVLDNLKKHTPNAHFILADFDLLQSAKSSKIGLNAPTVSKKLESSDEKEDYDDYLVPRGEADIFFPTDFRLISNMTTDTFGGRGRCLKSFEFFEEYGGQAWGKTVSGYNPLKEDFWNTSFFISSVGDGFNEDA